MTDKENLTRRDSLAAVAAGLACLSVTASSAQAADQENEAKPKKLVLQLPKNVNLELIFVDAPENPRGPTARTTHKVGVEVDSAGNMRWNGCGCQGGNCVC